MNSRFLAAAQALTTADEQFALGLVSPLAHSRARESALAEGLLSFAAEQGVRLEAPLYLDSRGEFRIVALRPSGAAYAAKGGSFGKELADALTRHNARTGISAGAHMLPENSWCFLNHFDAEKLVLEHAASAQATAT